MWKTDVAGLSTSSVSSSVVVIMSEVNILPSNEQLATLVPSGEKADEERSFSMANWTRPFERLNVVAFHPLIWICL